MTNHSSQKISNLYIKVNAYLTENRFLLLVILLVMTATYGFELVNLNLTIDEEIAAIQSAASVWRIENGRWGMFLLNKILFPFSVIPFVPLFVTLLFQIAAILLLLECLGIVGKFEQLIIGVVGLSYPGMAYMYTFSTTNYGVGIGLFCITLSLYIYRKGIGVRKFLSMIPAIFAVSIYQPLIPALISIYFLYVIYCWETTTFKRIKELRDISIVMIFSLLLYFVIQKLFLRAYGLVASSYMIDHFNFDYIRENVSWLVTKLTRLIFYIYSGDETIYGIEIRMIGIFLFVLGLGILTGILRKKDKWGQKFWMLFLLLLYMIIPFVGGVFTKGNIPLRSLVGMPFVLMGWAAFGLRYISPLYKYFVLLITIACTFQFISSSNHLFAASHLALEEDRILGSQLIMRIEDEKAKSGITDIKYFEMVGYVDRPDTPLIPRIENIGASFFGWDQGNSLRVVNFLKILGYYGIEPLELQQRTQFVKIGEEMPNWPDEGSVKVIDNTVIVKFSPYSKTQKKEICSLEQSQQILESFCLSN